MTLNKMSSSTWWFVFGESSPKFGLQKYDLNRGNGILSFDLKE